MKKIYFPIICLLCCFQMVVAQKIATVEIGFQNSEKTALKLIQDDYYLNEELEIFTSSNSKLKAKLDVSKNEIAQLVLNEDTLTLFLESENELEITLNQNNLKEEITFNGKGEKQNQFLFDFSQKFAADFSQDAMNQKMLELGIDAFEILIFQNRAKQKAYFENALKENSFSEKFTTYIKNQINYNYFHLLLAYPVANARAKQATYVKRLPSIMTDVLAQISIDDANDLNASAYRNFLSSYVQYYNSKTNDYLAFKSYDDALLGRFRVAKEHLKGKTLQYLMAKNLYDLCTKVHPETAKQLFKQLEEADNEGVYTKIIENKCDEWFKTKIKSEKKEKDKNSTAPRLKQQEFNLVDLDGKAVYLNDFKGQVIYVDFWASWCGPCRRQFPYAKKVKEQLTEKEKKKVVFLYISIDSNKDAWKRGIEQNKIEGVQTLSPGGWNSTATKHFKIGSIPRYMLINKKGEIVDYNAKRPQQVPEILKDIRNLIVE